MDSLHLFEAKRHTELYVGCCVGIMRQFLMVVETVVFRSESERLVPLHARFLPMGEPFQFRSRLHEKLHFHLLKLTHTEDKLPRDDFVTEGFSYLGDTERQLHAPRLLHIQIVDEYALGSLRTEINLACSLCRCPDFR